MDLLRIIRQCFKSIWTRG